MDEGFLQVVRAIRRALQSSAPIAPPARQSRTATRPHPEQPVRPSPRSSNLGLPRRFTDIDRDRFRDETFEFFAAFFENSFE